MSQRVTVIGDPHGCFNTFKALTAQIPKDNNRIIVIGDIIDRGPSSYELYRHVRDSRTEMIPGNHEFMFLNRNMSDEMMDLWLSNGGETVLQSVRSAAGVSKGEAMDKILGEMDNYFRQLPFYIKIPLDGQTELLVTHAGISKDFMFEFNGNMEQCLKADLWDERSLLWNRGDLAEIPGVIQISGHTPVFEGPKKVKCNYMLDTGCVYGSPGMGFLSAVMFESPEETMFFRQKNIDA